MRSFLLFCKGFEDLCRHLVVVMCMVPLILVAMMIGGSNSSLSWDSNGGKVTYLFSFQVVAIVGKFLLQYLNSYI